MNKLGWALVALMLLAVAALVPSPTLTEGLPIPLDAEAGYPPLESGYVGELAYRDDTISVEIETDRYLETPMYIARVKLKDASQLRTMMAGAYGSQRTALGTTLAARGNAVFATNGDYYSYSSTGLVVRQGHMWRCRADKKLDALIVDTAGDLHAVLGIEERVLDAAILEYDGPADQGGRILQAFTFGPALVVDGALAHDVFERPDKSGLKRAQRMVIAQDGPLSYVMICCEGPDNTNSQGLTLAEMANYALSLGVTTAYNLDGGGSTMMVFRGEKINALSTSKNRSVSDIIYFCTGVTP